MSQEFIIKLLGVWLGVLARMTIPFWRKLYQGKKIKFNLKYLRRTFASLVLSTIFTFILFPRLELMQEGLFNFESGFKLFCLCFGFGFGFNSILIEFTSWFEKKDT
ncbi:MAG: hypothetical protein NC912_05445 [Candidatus Omnitrophica bacterium]|nr:hypothetical protein [Candidatus Omnitrophota bacterium]